MALFKGKCTMESSLLSLNEHSALQEIKHRVTLLFSVHEFILFGSKARGSAQSDSDIDLLIVTERELDHKERHSISSVITQINLQYGTLFSFIVIGFERWNGDIYRLLPLHQNIEREGVLV